MRFDIPIIIRNVFNLSAPGTKICRSSATEDEVDEVGQSLESFVRGFATIDNLALVNVEGWAVHYSNCHCISSLNLKNAFP